MSALPAGQFNIHEAKTQFSRIVDRVEHGEEITLSRAGRPIAKIVPLPAKANRRGWGTLQGQVALSDDWDSAATNELVARDFGLMP